MIPLPHVERSPVNLHAFHNLWNKDVWIGVTVAMGICRQIIGNEIAAHCDKLRDRLPMIARHSPSKILRRFYAAGSGFNWVPGNRDWRPGTARICIQQIMANKHSQCRVRSEHAGVVYVGSHGERFALRCKTRKPDVLLPIAIGEGDGWRARGEARILRGETGVSGIEIGKEETALAVRLGFTTRGACPPG